MARVRRPSSLPAYRASSPSGVFPLILFSACLYHSQSCVISIVPPQTPEAIEPLVKKYVEQEFAKLNSKNKLKIENLHDGRPWLADHRHWNYEAAIRATEVRYAATWL